MLAEQRRKHILRDIQAQGTSTIAVLSRKYSVSEMTIRRDLKALEDEGQIRRTHGGALRQSEALVEPHYAAKQELNAAQKALIAEYAATHLVDDGDVIILEGGTTVTTMARYLTTKRGLTVITNGLYTANELRRLMPDATILSAGGTLRYMSFTYVGPFAERFFGGVHANKVFLSATGLTLSAGYTDPSPTETQVKQAMIAAATQRIMLLDGTKFGVTALVTVAAARDIDLLVTDATAPPDALAVLRDLGVDVRIAG